MYGRWSGWPAAPDWNTLFFTAKIIDRSKVPSAGHPTPRAGQSDEQKVCQGPFLTLTERLSPRLRTSFQCATVRERGVLLPWPMLPGWERRSRRQKQRTKSDTTRHRTHTNLHRYKMTAEGRYPSLTLVWPDTRVPVARQPEVTRTSRSPPVPGASPRVTVFLVEDPSTREAVSLRSRQPAVPKNRN
uniref:Uncharacterized protein n=1 Tax=Myotis myotis TaxID=51298 RepID=A0A7J7VYT9_MYOMY|nr:hypothetical protein mMyoMyo1_012264 [Myotis myotis]